jgi:hypothetical protein
VALRQLSLRVPLVLVSLQSVQASSGVLGEGGVGVAPGVVTAVEVTSPASRDLKSLWQVRSVMVMMMMMMMMIMMMMMMTMTMIMMAPAGSNGRSGQGPPGGVVLGLERRGHRDEAAAG